MNDLRYALRHIGRRPALAAVVVGTLALGIGANTAIFSAIDAAILRPPPYTAPDDLRIVRPVLRSATETEELPVWSYPMYEAFRDGGPSIGPLAAYTPNPGAYNLDTGDRPSRARVEMVSASYFALLGVRPAFGRAFLEDEDRAPGEHPVAVLSHETWTSSFASDTAVVGRAVRINTLPFTVIGVAPPSFRGLSDRADLWVPMMMAPALTFPRRLTGSVSFWHAVVARVPASPGAEALESRLALKAAVVAPQLPLADAFGDVTLDFMAVPLAAARVNPTVRTTLRVLMAAVAFVLLIVCVNVANLLLTQTAHRRRELSVRVALGAGPGTIGRVLLTESVVLGLLGGIAGLLIATWVLDLIRALSPQVPAGTADPSTAGFGLRVLLFNFAIALVAGVVVGLLPAYRVARMGVQAVLREDGGRGTGRGRARQALVAVEVALALVLLTGAGLMLRSLDHLRRIDPGFRPTRLLTASVPLPRQTYTSEATVAFLDAARERLTALPGIEAASAAYCLPVSGGCDNVGLEIRGRATQGDAPWMEVAMNMVDGGYFATMGIRLLRGRTFAAQDRAGAPRVAVLSRSAAERYWPDDDPLGARIRLTVGWDEDAEVIGVVDDVRMGALDAAPPPLVYLPYSQQSYNANYLVVRTSGPPLGATAVLQTVVRDLDPTLPLWDVQPMEERIGDSVADTRFTTILLGLAAGVATLLAALGVFGVMGFAVATRTREFGVRMALGARDGDVVRLVLGQGIRSTVAGLGLGLAGAFLLTRLLQSQLHGVAPTDPIAFAGGAAIMTAAALAAAWIPARRATRANPIEVLRHE